MEHRPVNRVVTGAEAGNLFQDRNIEVTTRSEEVVDGKETVVTEDVVVGKEVTETVKITLETLVKMLCENFTARSQQLADLEGRMTDL